MARRRRRVHLEHLVLECSRQPHIQGRGAKTGSFLSLSQRFLLVLIMGIRRIARGLRPCYHALRQPVGAADRAMLHN